jgi:uncharacterized iron-regulated protein
MTAVLLAAIIQADPYLLEIGARGRVVAGMGYTDLATGRAADPDDIARSARGLRFVFVGESHDQLAHHQAQADVIEALVRDGRQVVVGLEMFTRDNQGLLDPWTMGRWDEPVFIERAKWKEQWGMDYALYRPVFEAVRRHRLPMAALNIPRDWVRQVSRQGADSLTEEQRRWVPPLDLTNQDHKAVFTALIGGHPLEGQQGINMYSAQVAWDEAMAQAALDFMGGFPNPKRVMVVVAGSGHTMYGQGINWRITKRTGERTLGVVCLTSDGPREVSRGLGDFSFLSPPASK